MSPAGTPTFHWRKKPSWRANIHSVINVEKLQVNSSSSAHRRPPSPLTQSYGELEHFPLVDALIETNFPLFPVQIHHKGDDTEAVTVQDLHDFRTPTGEIT